MSKQLASLASAKHSGSHHAWFPPPRATPQQGGACTTGNPAAACSACRRPFTWLGHIVRQGRTHPAGTAADDNRGCTDDDPRRLYRPWCSPPARAAGWVGRRSTGVAAAARRPRAPAKQVRLWVSRPGAAAPSRSRMQRRTRGVSRPTAGAKGDATGSTRERAWGRPAGQGGVHRQPTSQTRRSSLKKSNATHGWEEGRHTPARWPGRKG